LSIAFVLACSDDDSTGTSEGELETNFELGTSWAETFTPVTVDVGISQGGTSVTMQQGEMHVEDLGDGSTHTFAMTPMGDGFSGEMMFFEPGEHELHFQGRLQMGGMMQDVGHHRITVHRQHRVVGPYWVEFEVDPAPVLQGEIARVRFLVFQLMGDAPGDPVEGLDVQVTIHDRDGAESVLSLLESTAGSYEAEHAFGQAGLYELHLEIDVGGNVETGDFHMPVLASAEDTGLDYMDHHGGSGHGMGI
jgi:hypothetical protein